MAKHEGVSEELDGHDLMVRLDTALAEFAARLPVVQRDFGAGAGICQFIAFGGFAEAGVVRLRPAAWVAIETARRQVQAFTLKSVIGGLPIEAFGQLAELADAADPRLGPTAADFEAAWTKYGWRMLNGSPWFHRDADDNDPLGVAEVDNSSAKPDWDSDFLRCPKKAVDALHSSFTCQYPEFSDDDEIIRKALKKSVRAIFQTFVSRLQPSTLHACEKLGAYGVREFNSITHWDPRIAKYRAQAALAIPLLGALLVNSKRTPLLPIRIAIDQRQSLVKAAASAFGVRKEVFRFLSGISLDDVGLNEHLKLHFWTESADYIVTCLSVLDPLKRPSCRDEWKAFFGIIRPLEGWKDHFELMIAPFLLRAAAAGWVTTRNRVERLLGHADLLGSFADYLNAIGEALANGARSTRKARAQEIRRTYAVRRGTLRLAVEAQRWRAATEREEVRLVAALLPDGTLSVAVLPYIVPEEMDGWKFVFLDSELALVSESHAMSHCVEVLFFSLAKGERLPFSVRRPDGERLATFDITIAPNDPEPSVALNDMRGFKNNEVSGELGAAIGRFVAEVARLGRGRNREIEQWLSRCEKQQRKFRAGLRDKLHARAKVIAIKPFAEKVRRFYFV